MHLAAQILSTENWSCLSLQLKLDNVRKVGDYLKQDKSQIFKSKLCDLGFDTVN